MSLRLRLTIWYSSVLAVTLLLFGIGLYFFLHAYIYNDVEKQLKSHAEKTFSRIQPKLSLTLKGLVFDLELQDRDLQTTSTFLQLYNVNLDSYSQSANLSFYDARIPISQQTLARLDDTQVFYARDTLLDQHILVYHMGIYTKDNANQQQLVGVLQTAVPISQYETFFTILKYMLLGLGMLTILLAATLGWLFARKALQPIERVIHSANLIQKSDDLDRRIEVDRSRDDETARLSHTINHMLARIQAIYVELDVAYRAQRRFVSDASHELRTPLTTIRGNIDLLDKIWHSTSNSEVKSDHTHQQMIREALQDMSSEAKRMSNLVNDLLMLARADARMSLEKKQLEIKPLIEEVVRKAQFLPRTVDWLQGDLTVLDYVKVHGNPDYLQQLFFIFIENSFKYTHQGYVKLDAYLVDQQVGIRITDTGIGMDDSEVPHIFERFYRADPSRGQSAGTGLGLSIAKWIIDEHQGSIEVLTSKNHGSTFVIWLPMNYLPEEG
jgi:two-component system OmpR family sensor kinase